MKFTKKFITILMGITLITGASIYTVNSTSIAADGNEATYRCENYQENCINNDKKLSRKERREDCVNKDSQKPVNKRKNRQSGNKDGQKANRIRKEQRKEQKRDCKLN